MDSMTTTREKSASERDIKRARAMAMALEPFFKIRSTMPLQYVRAFLLVAQHQGASVTELAKKAGVSQSVMSRHLLDIGVRNRYMEEGFGLIEYTVDPMELRRHTITLTPKGEKLMHDIGQALQWLEN